MAIHKVKVASKFRGEIVVNSLNMIIKGGGIYAFDDNQFSVNEIQTLLKKNILIIDDGTSAPEVQETPEEDDNVSFEETEENTETPKNTPVAWDIKKQKLVTQKEAVDQHIKDNMESPNKPVVWDAENKGLIGGKEATKKVFGQSEGIQMDVQTGDVDFAKEKEKPTEESETRISFKKGRGRPPKPVDPNAAPKVKLPRGRPPKPVDPNAVPQEKKPRGRPPKDEKTRGNYAKEEKGNIEDLKQSFKQHLEKQASSETPKVRNNAGKPIEDFVYNNSGSDVKFVDQEQESQLIKDRENSAAKLSEEEKAAKLNKYLKLDNNKAVE